MNLVRILTFKIPQLICFLTPLYISTVTLANTLNESVSLTMQALPAGTFVQGSQVDELGYKEQYGPAHKVSINRFYLSKKEVSIREFRTFVQATAYVSDAERNVVVWGDSSEGCWSAKVKNSPKMTWVAEHSWRNPGFLQSESHPVVCVSWNDAMAYVAWLKTETDLDYRLPSESEFEYALRAGTQSPNAWRDDEPICTQVNHADKSLRGAFPDWKNETSDCSDGYQFSAPVGSFKANSFGIYNLIDNVSEWTADCWYETYEGAPNDGRHWVEISAVKCKGRVLRGGDFTSPVSQLRSSHRTWIPAEFRTYHAGFRIALSR